MNDENVFHRFQFSNRKFTVSAGKFKHEDTEYIQLDEIVAIETQLAKYSLEKDPTFDQSDPILFATRSKQNPEIHISMHYEGLPIDIMRQFIRIVEKKWP